MSRFSLSMREIVSPYVPKESEWLPLKTPTQPHLYKELLQHRQDNNKSFAHPNNSKVVAQKLRDFENEIEKSYKKRIQTLRLRTTTPSPTTSTANNNNSRSSNNNGHEDAYYSLPQLTEQLIRDFPVVPAEVDSSGPDQSPESKTAATMKEVSKSYRANKPLRACSCKSSGARTGTTVNGRCSTGVIVPSASQVYVGNNNNRPLRSPVPYSKQRTKSARSSKTRMITGGASCSKTKINRQTSSRTLAARPSAIFYGKQRNRLYAGSASSLRPRRRSSSMLNSGSGSRTRLARKPKTRSKAHPAPNEHSVRASTDTDGHSDVVVEETAEETKPRCRTARRGSSKLSDSVPRIARKGSLSRKRSLKSSSSRSRGGPRKISSRVKVLTEKQTDTGEDSSSSSPAVGSKTQTTGATAPTKPSNISHSSTPKGILKTSKTGMDSPDLCYLKRLGVCTAQPGTEEWSSYWERYDKALSEFKLSEQIILNQNKEYKQYIEHYSKEADRISLEDAFFRQSIGLKPKATHEKLGQPIIGLSTLNGFVFDLTSSDSLVANLSSSGSKDFRLEIDVRGCDPDSIAVITEYNLMKIVIPSKQGSGGPSRSLVIGIPPDHGLKDLDIYPVLNGWLVVECADKKTT